MKLIHVAGLCAGLMVLPGLAHAQVAAAGAASESNSVAGSSSGSESGAAAGASSNNSITFGGSQSYVENRLQAPNAIAPSFAASINTCFGGAGASVSFPGGSIAGGGSRVDDGCDLIRSVEAVRRGGSPINRTAADVMMCQNDVRVAEAYQIMGLTCAQIAQTMQSQQSSAPIPAEALTSPSTNAGIQRTSLTTGPDL